jgi:hypothetical protein
MHNSGMSVSAALCSVKLRDGNPCRSVATHDGFCAYNAALADEFGQDVVGNGDPTDEELHLVFALSYATEIRAVVDSGRGASIRARALDAEGTCDDGSSARRGRLTRRGI